jgi:hypothetical protein
MARMIADSDFEHEGREGRRGKGKTETIDVFGTTYLHLWALIGCGKTVLLVGIGKVSGVRFSSIRIRN